MTVRDITDRLNALGLRIPADASADLTLGANPTAREVRAVGGRLIAKWRGALSVRGSEIGSIAAKMHALAQKTDPAGAPKLALAPEPKYGTNLQFRDGRRWKERYIEEDAWAWKAYLDHLALVFHEEGWPWRFIETSATPERDGSYDRVLLVPAAVVAPLSELAFVLAGNPPEATPRAAATPAAPEVKALREPKEIIGEQRYMCTDGECVDGASDYVGFVADLASLTDGALNPDDVTCVERERVRTLTVAARGRRYETPLQGDTDWLDLPPLLACLNRILTDAGATGRLYEHASPTGGQEIAVAYATPNQVRELEAEGYVLVHPKPLP